MRVQRVIRRQMYNSLHKRPQYNETTKKKSEEDSQFEELMEKLKEKKILLEKNKALLEKNKVLLEEKKRLLEKKKRLLEMKKGLLEEMRPARKDNPYEKEVDMEELQNLFRRNV